MRLSGIYAIADAEQTYDIRGYAGAVLDAGIRVVQYRAKRGADRELIRALAAMLHRRNALLIVNDDLEAALDADGLHVGPEDLEAYRGRDVRAELGTRILGISCGTPQEIAAAEALGADYLGVGPFAVTQSKHDAGAAIGTEGLRAVVEATRLPVVAIGGIDVHLIPEVRGCGARMAGVISAISRGPDIFANARALVEAWER